MLKVPLQGKRRTRSECVVGHVVEWAYSTSVFSQLCESAVDRNDAGLTAGAQ